MTAVEFAQQMPQLRFLPALQLIRLAEQATISTLAKKQSFHATLLPNAPCIYLLEGGAIIQPSIGAQEAPVPQLALGQAWINLSTSLCNSTTTYLVQAFTPARIMAIPRSVLLNAARKNPDLAFHLAEVCACETQAVLRWHQAMLSKSVEGRTAFLLARLHRQSAHGDTLALPLGQTQLAQLIGCSREVLSRALTSLVHKGHIIRHGASISVLSPEDLEQIP